MGITWHYDEEGAAGAAQEVEDAGRRAAISYLDLTQLPAAAGVVDDLAEELGGLGVLVNNAGADLFEDFLELSYERWRTTLDLNLSGAFLCSQRAARRMLGRGAGGRIVNVTFVHEHLPKRGAAGYAASKAGLGLLTKVMALELAEHGITANAVAPGEISTPIQGEGAGNPEDAPRPSTPAGPPGVRLGGGRGDRLPGLGAQQLRDRGVMARRRRAQPHGHHRQRARHRCGRGPSCKSCTTWPGGRPVVRRPGEWTNWSGSLRFTPAAFETPENEEELSDILRRAAEEGRNVRAVGAGHSASALVETRDVLVSLERMSGLLDHDTSSREATVGAGSPLQDLGRELHDVGLALENYGGRGPPGHRRGRRHRHARDGRGLGCFSSNVVAARMVAGSGEVVDVGEEDLDLLRAVRVSLGARGVLTELRLRVRPAFRLHRREWCLHIDDCMAHLDRLIDENRNFDFYWHPRRDEAQLRALNVPGEEPHELFGQLPPTPTQGGA